MYVPICLSIVENFVKNCFLKIKITRWRHDLKITTHKKIFTQLYADCNGFYISKIARKNNPAIEYTYGEIIFESFIALLSLTKPDEKTIFLDLGSGIGKAVIAMTMVFDIKKSIGIEFLTLLYKAALTRKDLLMQNKNYLQKAKKIKFLNGNFLTYNIQEATIIFLQATVFIGDYWQEISEFLEQVQSKTVVITVSKKIKSPKFKFLRSYQLEMSWGTSEAYIHQRN